MTAIALATLVALVGLLAYMRAQRLYWFTLPPLLLWLIGAHGALPGGVLAPLWGLYAAVLLFYFVPDLRKRLITRPLLRRFREVVPPMSETEQQALEAGNVWWDGELFSGRPDWNLLLLTPAPRLTDEERAFLDGPVQEFCALLDDWQITEELRDLPPAAWDFIRRHRLFGMIIPKSYGGLGFSAYAHSEVVTKIATRSVTAAVTVMVPNSLGPAKLLLHYGTKAQKDSYLPRLARADEIPCFALTGPQAGSDATSMPDRGIVCRGQWEGRDVLGIRLSFDKRYITLAPVATLIGLAFRLEDPDCLLGDGDDTERGITVALIPRATPGIEIGERHFPLNIPFHNGPLRARDLFIPLDSIIGGRDGIGQGWRMLVECLAEGRGISLPALATGAGKAACRYTGAYARVRRQFGQPIGRFEGVEEVLARIAGLTYQMDAARVLTLGALDRGEKPSVVSAIVKYHLTERYRRVINDAMDIQGGSGICLGPRNLIGRAYQSIPISITVEGANILTRSMIIFGQGVIRCHPYVLKEFAAARDPDPVHALDQFDGALFNHAGFLASNLVRSLWLGLSRGRFAGAPVKGPLRPYIQKLSWMSAAFALTADITLMSLGGALKRKERLSARLGDILSELYLSSAVIRQFREQGDRLSDLPLLRWALEESLYRIQEAFRGLLRNLPVRPVAWLLRPLVFPTGLPFHEPDDRIGRQAARTLLEPGEARERLTASVFVTDDPHEQVARLERAFRAAAEVEPIERTLRTARRAGQIGGETFEQQVAAALELGIIDRADADRLAAADRLRLEAIAVDSHAPNAIACRAGTGGGGTGQACAASPIPPGGG